jgi:hypothetical protein
MIVSKCSVLKIEDEKHINKSSERLPDTCQIDILEKHDISATKPNVSNKCEDKRESYSFSCPLDQDIGNITKSCDNPAAQVQNENLNNMKVQEMSVLNDRKPPGSILTVGWDDEIGNKNTKQDFNDYHSISQVMLRAKVSVEDIVDDPEVPKSIQHLRNVDGWFTSSRTEKLAVLETQNENRSANDLEANVTNTSESFSVSLQLPVDPPVVEERMFDLKYGVTSKSSRFKKNLVRSISRLNRITDSEKDCRTIYLLKDMDKILPKESERELQVRTLCSFFMTKY